MANKVYKKIREILNEKVLIIMIILMSLSFIKFPYYINGPGGIVDLNHKIKIEDEYKNKGTFNMAFVAEYKANIYTLLYASLNPKFDIIKKEDYINNGETYEDMKVRADLGLNESLSNAVITGYSLAGYDIDIKNIYIYVTYIYDIADTDLKVGDRLVQIDNKEIKNYADFASYIKTKEVGDKVSIKVINGSLEYERYAYIKEVNGDKYIGIYLTYNYDYELPKKIEFKFDKNESGPSGGVMLSLEIYNSLVSEDITKGLKIAGTGAIDINGNIDSIGGVKYKLAGAAKSKAKVFFVPKENYKEALEEKNKNNYKMDIVSIEKVEDAINYLNNL